MCKATTPSASPPASSPPVKLPRTPTMRRMPTYLHRLLRMQAGGEQGGSCADLAAYMNIPHILVRKDVAMTGLRGNRRYGFRVNELIEAILRFVGWDRPSTATLIGAGSLGTALLGFADFETYRFSITSVFDADPEKIGREVHGFRIYDIAEIRKRLHQFSPKIGIICVPAVGAQLIADILVSLGIRYIWNFANVCLQVPPGVIVQREVIAGGLAVLSAKIKQSEAGGGNVGQESE